MRPWLVHLFCGCALLLPALPARAQLSEKMLAQVRATLPNYAPPPRVEPKPAESSIGSPAPLSDEPIVVLPNFRVVDRVTPTNDPDKWLDKQGVQRKALKEYKDSMNALDWALNRWYIPLPFGYSLTPSPQDRADAAYAERKVAGEVRQLSSVVDAISQLDPDYAKKLSRDADLSRHPGN